MESTDELIKINIKKCTCYHFHDILKIEDFNLDNMLIDDVIIFGYLSYKTLII